MMPKKTFMFHCTLLMLIQAVLKTNKLQNKSLSLTTEKATKDKKIKPTQTTFQSIEIDLNGYTSPMITNPIFSNNLNQYFSANDLAKQDLLNLVNVNMQMAQLCSRALMLLKIELDQ
ncbi:hypothetical protein RF11_11811 [Thelohanellus kitauei]|uniref:Uncharacterized protein n=1 Tax=Thelohanellus kitauei TaxID=669202 RepID=A0A0C2NHH5_THEKT|nr:hypothetical protein RF11_11811 [Thelohanellus kitauei]